MYAENDSYNDAIAAIQYMLWGAQHTDPGFSQHTCAAESCTDCLLTTPTILN